MSTQEQDPELKNWMQASSASTARPDMFYQLALKLKETNTAQNNQSLMKKIDDFLKYCETEKKTDEIIAEILLIQSELEISTPYTDVPEKFKALLNIEKASQISLNETMEAYRKKFGALYDEYSQLKGNLLSSKIKNAFTRGGRGRRNKRNKRTKRRMSRR